MPERTGKSPLIFYTQGITTARGKNIGDVVRYFFLVDEYNLNTDDQQKFQGHIGYVAHEIWFSIDKKRL
jgi:hypothetical protein